jgi:hypothetical protein
MAQLLSISNYARGPLGLMLSCLLAADIGSQGILFAQENATTRDYLTPEDLVRILSLNVLKVKVAEVAEKDVEVELRYWVESFTVDGAKSIHDKTSIGLGTGDGHIVYRLPRGMDPMFGIFSDVNSSSGKSKLVVDTEAQGSEGWSYRREQLLPAEQDVVIAIRTVGASNVPDGNSLSEALDELLRGPFNRIDVFKSRISVKGRREK